ncbi:Lipoprotein-releasing system transmembrane protein LolE [Meiothermus luteus]|jgi:lipoprotein-releasing system permease protein|uniref:Lipoprotein-releasing system transmembrane protein LolE n=1 Tax=Meiothermus luteus TaxID=2026184 RepID=A0A399EFA7_9DEIN|nr:FtsX-like permease family protein [Meiothermus luteus]RIH82638.1 Lipoprotein-releasing system transmembrane protein LolE [Meiothermus luteus]RMH57214.1 MAG: FtsX-like permease family protein [Deinococcota bacterium]
MRFVWFLASRHLRYRRVQSLISLLGVAVGIMVLTTALSLTNGFTRGLVEATLKAVPHLHLQSLNPEESPPPPPNPEVVGQAPVLLTKALLTRRAEAGRPAGADFATLIGLGEGGQGVYPELDLTRLEPGTIVLGSALARSLGAYPGDRLFLVSINQKRIELRVVGVFQTGNYLLDSGFAFTTLADTRELVEQPKALSGYQLRLRNPERAPEVGLALAGKHYFPQTWQSSNRTLIEQLALQKRVIGVVVFLIVVVAALGMASVLVLTVVEKTQDIALLRVMGAQAVQVAGVFALEGLILGTAGIALGNLLGYGLSRYFAWQPVRIPGELYFLTYLPVEIRASDFAWVSTMSLLVVLLASLLPLWRALRVKPGEVLR